MVADGGAVIGRSCRDSAAGKWSVLLTFSDLMAVANAAFQRLLGFRTNRSISRNHEHCDDKQCREQRKRAIQCF
jgi:hypothetical protein